MNYKVEERKIILSNHRHSLSISFLTHFRFLLSRNTLYRIQYSYIFRSFHLFYHLSLHQYVTGSLFKINLYAARGPCNETGSFYTNCQRNATTLNIRFFIVYHTSFIHNSTLHVQGLGTEKLVC